MLKKYNVTNMFYELKLPNFDTLINNNTYVRFPNV